MIERDEIEYQASELDVHPVNVERDYVFGWLLKAMSENSYLNSTLIFKGGNAMRKAYYPHIRFSSDLDFAVEGPVDADCIVAEINAACEAAQADCGVRFVTDRTSLVASHALDKERTSYKGSVYFYDFYGKPSKLTISIRVDVSDYERVHLPLVTRPIHHPYSDAADCVATVRCLALEELLANKLKCLLQRRYSFDLYDLVYATFFERSIEVDRSTVVRTFLRKTIFERSPGAARAILLGLPLAVMRGAFDKYIAAPVASRFSFDDAVSAFTNVVQGFFEGFGSTDRFQYAFFGPEHRNTIMEAGAGKRLLRLRYHGRDRVIEPYALAYKRAMGKEPAEYFYAFDRSQHGKGPSMKTFLSPGVEALELLEDTFEPQYEIELSKAGARTVLLDVDPPVIERDRTPDVIDLRFPALTHAEHESRSTSSSNCLSVARKRPRTRENGTPCCLKILATQRLASVVSTCSRATMSSGVRRYEAGRGAAPTRAAGGSRAPSSGAVSLPAGAVWDAIAPSLPGSNLAASSASAILTGLCGCVEDASTAISPARRLGRTRAGSLVRDTGNTRCSTPADPWPSTSRWPEIRKRLACVQP